MLFGFFEFGRNFLRAKALVSQADGEICEHALASCDVFAVDDRDIDPGFLRGNDGTLVGTGELRRECDDKNFRSRRMEPPECLFEIKGRDLAGRRNVSLPV